MKRILALFCLTMLVALCFLGCSNTFSLNYNEKLSKAQEYSFNIIYNYKEISSDGTESESEPIYISCYQKNGSYAYRFSLEGFDNEKLAYRHIFSDRTFYEVAEYKTGGFWTGEYKKTELVDASYDKNIMYKYTSYITGGSLFTLFQEGTAVTYNGKECTQMDITYEQSTYTFVFENDTSDLVKFVLTSSDAICTLEYSDYRYSDIDEECLIIPSSSVSLTGVSLYREVTDFTYEYILR